MVRERRRRRAALAAAVHLGGSAGGPLQLAWEKDGARSRLGHLLLPLLLHTAGRRAALRRALFGLVESGSAAEMVPQCLAWLASHPARLARPPFSRRGRNRSRRLACFGPTGGVSRSPCCPRGSPCGQLWQLVFHKMWPPHPHLHPPSGCLKLLSAWRRKYVPRGGKNKSFKKN